jgi:hypothetical protein
MATSTSRPARWNAACSDARSALADIEAAQATLEAAFSTLRDLQDEYAEWQSNLIDAAQGSALDEKLQAMSYLSLEPDTELDVSELESALDEAEAADLPRGFGRD